VAKRVKQEKKATPGTGGPNTRRKRTASTFLPKTVAGVPVPKALRRSATLAAIFDNPLAREALAVTLLAAAEAASSALRNNATAMRSTGRSGGPVAATGSDAGASATKAGDLVEHTVGAVGGMITDALGKAATRILPEAFGREPGPVRGRRAVAQPEGQPNERTISALTKARTTATPAKSAAARQRARRAATGTRSKGQPFD
jgi:hypothetical protein